MTSPAPASPSPLFTVIIPCKDRAEYLKHTLRTCMMQNYEPMEVIVSDDGSSDHTRDVVEDAARRDSRIRYTRPPGKGGMRDNFEYVLSCVQPGFVMALGGDDGLMPNGISRMRELIETAGVELLSWAAPVFTYPGARGPGGQLTIYRERGVRTVDSRSFLSRQARDLNYLADVESPMFYVKGVVSTALIDRVRHRSADGRFYQCPTPDGYSGIVLAGEVSHWVFSGQPLSIYGLSPASQGLAYLADSNKARKDSEKFYSDVTSKKMHPELAAQPYSPLITLMTADYLLTARDLPGWGGIFPSINFRSLLEKSINELRHGLYGTSRICRELAILRQIADAHNLGDYFREKIRGARRYRERQPFQGTGVNSRAFLIDTDSYDVHNIVEAAFMADVCSKVYRDARIASIVKILTASVKYRIKALRRGEPFPPESTWISDVRIASS